MSISKPKTLATRRQSALLTANHPLKGVLVSKCSNCALTPAPTAKSVSSDFSRLADPNSPPCYDPMRTLIPPIAHAPIRAMEDIGTRNLFERSGKPGRLRFVRFALNAVLSHFSFRPYV